MTFTYIVSTQAQAQIEELLAQVGEYHLPFLPGEYSWIEYATADMSEDDIFVKYMAGELEFRENDRIPELDDLLACICYCGNGADIGDGTCTACHTGMTSVFEEMAMEHLPEWMHNVVKLRTGEEVVTHRIAGKYEIDLSRSEHPHLYLFEFGVDGYHLGYLEGTAGAEDHVMWHVHVEDCSGDWCTMQYKDPEELFTALLPRIERYLAYDYSGFNHEEDEEEGPFGGAFRDQDDYENWRLGGISYLNST